MRRWRKRKHERGVLDRALSFIMIVGRRGLRRRPAASRPNVLSEPIPIPSLRDVQSQQLAAHLTELAQAMSACEGVDEFAETGWLPERFFALLEELYAAFDAYVAHNLAASDLRILCRAGCSRCCHQAVHGVYAFEIVNLYRLLRPLGEFDAIRAAFAAYAEQFQATVEQVGESDSEGDPVQHAVEAFIAAALPCPLLENDRCRVYAQRPMPCRMYHSLTDPVHCLTPRGETFNIEMPAAVSEILWSLSDRLAFPFSTFLAQGMVTFAAGREFRPWSTTRTT